MPGFVKPGLRGKPALEKSSSFSLSLFVSFSSFFGFMTFTHLKWKYFDDADPFEYTILKTENRVNVRNQST